MVWFASTLVTLKLPSFSAVNSVLPAVTLLTKYPLGASTAIVKASPSLASTVPVAVEISVAVSASPTVTLTLPNGAAPSLPTPVWLTVTVVASPSAANAVIGSKDIIIQRARILAKNLRLMGKTS